MVKINLIKADRVLSKTRIDIADYVINPYRGCEYGCVYCYAKNNKNMQKRSNDWGRFVDVKINILEKLKFELENIKIPINKILIGSTTEVFQPVDNKYTLMADILQLLKGKNIPVVILTKSILVKKYISYLDYSKLNEIYFTINTEKVRELFEPISTAQSLRIKVIEKLVTAGIKVNIYVSPFFPFLSDYKDIFKLIKDLPSEKDIGLYFESYNILAGNWNNLKSLLNNDIKIGFIDIYSSSENYYNYWDFLKKSIIDYNRKYGFRLKFFIYPYNNYYSFFSYK